MSLPQENLTFENPRDKFFCALLEAQKEFPAIGKDTKGFDYRYASLPAILKEVLPILNKHGFVLTFSNELEVGDTCKETEEKQVDSRTGKETRILNRVPIFYVTTTATLSGHGFQTESRNKIPGDDKIVARANSAQRAGAVITYGRRYALCALLGIAADDDVDAHNDGAASQKQERPQRQQTTQNRRPPQGKYLIYMNPARGDNDKAKSKGAWWDKAAGKFYARGDSLAELVETFRDFHIILTPEQQNELAQRQAQVIHHKHEANTPPAFADMQGDELPPPAAPKNPFIYLELEPSVVEKLTIDQLTNLRRIEKMAIMTLSKTQTEPTSARIKSMFKTACDEQGMDNRVSNWLLIDVKHFH